MKVAVPINQSLRMILPGAVGLVTSQYRGRFDVSTVSWMAPVSQQPPLVAIAVRPSTLTYELIKRGGEFVVNIPTLDVLRQVVTCGRLSGSDVDKFAQTGLTMDEAQTVRAPVIEQCVGVLECVVVDTFQPGDHTVFFGQVAYASAEDGTFDQTWLLNEKDLRPLHHLGGFWFGTIDERIDATPNDLKEASKG